MRKIDLDLYGIIITLDGSGGGTVTDELHDGNESAEEYNAACAGITSMILAHACAGIDVASPEYSGGIQTAIESASNNLP